jgi:hypothetical protein
MGFSGATKDYFGVSLRIHHGTNTPDEISQALQREPDYSGVKGTPRGRIHGVPSSATWREHYWCAGFREGDTPEAGIAAVVAFLLDKEKDIVPLLERGGRADIYVFVSRDTVFAMELHPSVFMVLGRMGVSLGVEVMSALPPKAAV